MNDKTIKRTIPTESIERAFIKSYGGWDEVSVGVLQFYECLLTPEMGLDAEKEYPVVVVDTEQSKVFVYDDINGKTVEILVKNFSVVIH